MLYNSGRKEPVKAVTGSFRLKMLYNRAQHVAAAGFSEFGRGLAAVFLEDAVKLGEAGEAAFLCQRRYLFPGV